MAALVLPPWPAPASVTLRLVSARNEMAPAFGGPVQRQGRMGSRYALDVVMPPMRYRDAQEWADIDDEAATVVMSIPQPGLDTGTPGAPVVDGGGQSGSSINLRGLTPHYAIRKNQWLTLIIDDQRFAYRAKIAVVADGGGEAVVPLRTLLRQSPPDAALVEIADPKIEGYPTVPDGAWTVDSAHITPLVFTITERA